MGFFNRDAESRGICVPRWRTAKLVLTTFRR
jgi:hypothetical protein